MRIAREQRRYDRLANAHAVIANVDAPAELAAARFQPDVAAGRRMPDRIGEQVLECAAKVGAASGGDDFLRNRAF
jgi:hypothetical protein